MHGKSKKTQWPEYIGMTMAAAGMAFLLSMEGMAAGDIEDIPVATSGNAMAIPIASPAVAEGKSRVSSERKSKEKDENILSVELPVVAEEESPFDFFLDPCSLIYETDAMRYGGGTVEEGATLLFRNREGEYAFSSCSDKLEVISGDEEPVIVTVSAFVSDTEEIALVGQEELSQYEEPSIYLALTDSQGNEQPIFQGTKAMIRMEPDSGAYSFGLTGACNVGADWQDISVCPKVQVTWHVEPALIEDEDELEMDEDILLEDDVTGQESARGSFGEPPTNATIQDGETDGITEPETSDSGSGSLGQPAQVFSGEISDSPSGQNSPDDSREGANSSDTVGNSVSDIPESREETADSSGVAREDENRDATGQKVSADETAAVDDREESVLDQKEPNG